MSTASNNNIAPSVSQEDNDDGKRKFAAVAVEVKPASFGREKKKPDTSSTCKVIKINPKIGEEPFKAIAFIAVGHMWDKHLCGRLFENKTSAKKQQFLETTGCINRSVKCIDGNGNKIARAGRNRSWDLQAMVVPVDKMLSNEQIVGFVNDTLSPLTWNHHLQDQDAFDKGYLDKAKLPKLKGDATDDITEVDTWDKALADVEEIVFCAGKEVAGGNLTNWINKDPDHVYNLFTVGKVPMNFYKKKFHFPRSNLKAQDVERFNKFA